MHESDLYPIVRRAWAPRAMVRIDAPSRPGISDLVLIDPEMTIFTEVKLAMRAMDKLALTPHQFRFLAEVEASGGCAIVLIWVLKSRSWYVLTLKEVTEWWPHVRAQQGKEIVGDLGKTLVPMIRCMDRKPGSRLEKPLFGGIITAASNVGLRLVASDKPVLTTSSRSKKSVGWPSA